MGCLVLKHQAGRGGGETRDNKQSTVAALQVLAKLSPPWNQ